MNCLCCNSVSNSKSYYPDVMFNKRQFSYLRCNNCRLIFLSPSPSEDDLMKMYPIEYQNGIDLTIHKDLTQNLGGLRYSYSYQFDLINKFAPGKKMADYGCGNANFLINALHQGYLCDGVEYNPDFIKLLKEKISNTSFYTIDQFFSDPKKYDIIRLSNVLEHLSNPTEVLDKLYSKLEPGGILLVEGPIEENFSIAQFFRKSYFVLRSKLQKAWVMEHNPTHMFFSDRSNQQKMVANKGVVQVHFSVREAAWPFPDKISLANGFGSFCKAIIAKISIMMSKVFTSFGNTFIYVGRKK